MYLSNEIEAKKRAFAAAFLRSPMNPVEAARSIENRHAYVDYIVSNWQFDIEVQQYMNELRDERGAAANLPAGKEEFLGILYREVGAIRDPETRLKYYKLVADVSGYIDKPASVVNNNLAVDNRKVVLMPPPQSRDEWEQETIAQQARLINAAS